MCFRKHFPPKNRKLGCYFGNVRLCKIWRNLLCPLFGQNVNKHREFRELECLNNNLPRSWHWKVFSTCQSKNGLQILLDLVPQRECTRIFFLLYLRCDKFRKNGAYKIPRPNWLRSGQIGKLLSYQRRQHTRSLSRPIGICRLITAKLCALSFRRGWENKSSSVVVLVKPTLSLIEIRVTQAIKLNSVAWPSNVGNYHESAIDCFVRTCHILSRYWL